MSRCIKGQNFHHTAALLSQHRFWKYQQLLKVFLTKVDESGAKLTNFGNQALAYEEHEEYSMQFRNKEHSNCLFME